MLARLLSRSRKKPAPPIPVPTFQQIEPRRPRLLIPLIAIAFALGAYLAWPEYPPPPSAPPIVATPVIVPLPAPIPASSPATAPEPPAIPDEPATKIIDKRKEKTIYIGPRGGRYHYSASGKKVYERRK